MANEILKFAETSTGTNLLTTAEYTADAERLIGNQPGIARLKLVNKALRQSSFMSKVFADYLIQQTGGNVLDDGDDATLLAKMSLCFATGLPTAAIIDMPIPNIPAGFLKCNGAAVSRTTYSALFQKLVTDQGYTAQTFTVTIATPAVVTKTAHGFTGGERLRLTTTGTLPSGLTVLTDYFVWYIDANTFRLQAFSDVLAGTFVNTTGTQTGTHSFTRSLWGLGDGTTTFNVPDFRGVMRRAWDDSRGINPSQAIASFQMDAIQNITGAVTGTDVSHIRNNHSFTGAFARGSGGTSFQQGYDSGAGTANMLFDASLVARTSTETRTKTYAVMPLIKY